MHGYAYTAIKAVRNSVQPRSSLTLRRLEDVVTQMSSNDASHYVYYLV